MKLNVQSAYKRLIKALLFFEIGYVEPEIVSEKVVVAPLIFDEVVDSGAFQKQDLSCQAQNN